VVRFSVYGKQQNHLGTIDGGIDKTDHHFTFFATAVSFELVLNFRFFLHFIALR
jgi:hypothetical protein